jgi:hypothetical protein
VERPSIARVLAGALVLVPLVLGFRWMRRALASPEQHVRWLIEDAAEGFGDADLGDSLEPFADDWQHGERPYDRAFLRDALLAVFHEERDPATHAFLLAVEVDEDAFAIAIDGERARVSGTARFTRAGGSGGSGGARSDEAPPAIWTAAFEAELERRHGEWRAVRSSHRDLEGRGL